MNTSKEMTIILDRNYSLLGKKEKNKINEAVKNANKPVQVSNNFPALIRNAIKQTAKVQKTKITQDKYYDAFLSQLDTSIEFISSNDTKPTSPTLAKNIQKMFPNIKINSDENESIENYYYPNFEINKDNDHITFNTYQKYLSGVKRPSIIRMHNLLKYFEETTNVPDTRKYEYDFFDINYLKNYNSFTYHQTLFNDLKQEINYIFQIITDSLKCLDKMNKAIEELLSDTQNTLTQNIEWIRNFSKFNNIALAKLDLAQKILHLEEIKLTDISKITLENRNNFFKKINYYINYYIEEAHFPFYNDVLTGKPINTIIGNSIDHYFSEKYYDITSPNWIPVQINEANFIYLISVKAILDFLHEMPYRIKSNNDLLNTPSFNLKKQNLELLASLRQLIHMHPLLIHQLQDFL